MSARVNRQAVMASLVIAITLTACAAPIGGQGVRGASKDLSAIEIYELAGAVTDAHRELASMTKTVVNRDPYSVDKFSTVEVAVGGQVHRVVTFDPTSSALYRIEEIRCLGQQNYATPIPDDLDVPADPTHSWVQFAAEPAADAPDSAQLVAYFCDWGYPTSLDWDVQFLLDAINVTDLGYRTVDQDQLHQLRVDIPVDTAYQVPGLGWVGDAGVPDNEAKVVQVDLLIGSDDLVRQLNVDLQVNGRSLGTDIEFGPVDANLTVEPPDQAQVVTG